MGGRSRAGMWGLWLLLVAGNATWAQDVVPAAPSNSPAGSSTSPAFDALFQRMYKEPGNLDVSFRFAELATQVGDYEAAIGALERMLFFNPNLPRVRLELGVLYFKLGSYAMARSYFESALAAPDAPPDVQAKVQEFIAEIDRRMSPHKWAVFAHAGIRSQTNANAGPDGLLVKAIGQDAVLNSQFARARDMNWFALFGVNYAYDLLDGNGDMFEISASGYYAKQVQLSQFDLGVVEVLAGPRFGLPQQLIPGGSLKLYGIGTTTTLAQNPYFSGPGAGASVRFVIDKFARFEPSFEYRIRTFKDSDLYPTSSQQSGKLMTVAMVADGNLFEVLPWATRAALDFNRVSDFDFAFNSYDRQSVDIALPIPVDFGSNGGGLRFVIAPAFGISRTIYRAPNFLVDPDVARLDREWHVGGIWDVYLPGHFGLRTQVQYSKTKSSLSNFETRNLSISFGPTARF